MWWYGSLYIEQGASSLLVQNYVWEFWKHNEICQRNPFLTFDIFSMWVSGIAFRIQLFPRSLQKEHFNNFEKVCWIQCFKSTCIRRLDIQNHWWLKRMDLVIFDFPNEVVKLSHRSKSISNKKFNKRPWSNAYQICQD